MQQAYDGDRLRGKKVDGGWWNTEVVYYLRSSVLGGQVVAEINGSGGWQRGYVYSDGGQLIALQQGGVEWVHADMQTKSQRLTNQSGAVTTTIEMDPFGGEASYGYYGRQFTFNSSRQPQKFTSYIRDQHGADEAMHRRYNRW